jgi:hypothetical protein
MLMTTKEALEEVLLVLPDHRLNEVLDFARFLSWQEEAAAWRDFGRAQLARAYGPDEPDYTLDDVKPEQTHASWGRGLD